MNEKTYSQLFINYFINCFSEGSFMALGEMLDALALAPWAA